VHRPDPDVDIEETLSALSELVTSGKVRAIGTSSFPAAQIVEAQWVADRRGLRPFRTEQPPYSIVNRGIERDVLPVCLRYGMGTLVWSPLGQGLLTGRFRRDGGEGTHRSDVIAVAAEAERLAIVVVLHDEPRDAPCLRSLRLVGAVEFAAVERGGQPVRRAARYGVRSRAARTPGLPAHRSAISCRSPGSSGYGDALAQGLHCRAAHATVYRRTGMLEPWSRSPRSPLVCTAITSPGILRR
jgi:hypothetical protein